MDKWSQSRVHKRGRQEKRHIRILHWRRRVVSAAANLEPIWNRNVSNNVTYLVELTDFWELYKPTLILDNLKEYVMIGEYIIDIVRNDPVAQSWLNS